MTKLQEQFFLPPPYIFYPLDKKPMKNPPEGCIAIYICTHLMRPSVSPSPLILDIQNHYQIALAQLTPNCWPQILSFIAICKLKGIPATLNTFKMFHAIQRSNSRSKSRGWWCLYNKSRILTVLDRPSAHHDWKNKFIFVQTKGDWGLPE